MLNVLGVTSTNTCPDSKNVCLIVEYSSFLQHEYTPTPGMKQNNEMGGCIAIVRYKWARWVLADHTYTDPMGLGIINSLDFKAGDYKICSINAYFIPANGGTGLATHHTHHRLKMPHYVKRPTPNEYARSLMQKLLRGPIGGLE
jgi:hypothetical protein